MKNKGFTLIELLAVIVILAIIALIAVPIILSIVDNAKKESQERSIELYASAVKNAAARYQIDNPSNDVEGKFTQSNKGATLNGNVDLSVEYDGDVKCDTIEVYSNGTVYLADCTVDGNSVEYTYGTKQKLPASKPQYYTFDLRGTVGITSAPESPSENPPEGKNVYLGYNISNGVISEAFACFVKGGNQYCLKGNDATAYEDNQDVIRDAYSEEIDTCSFGDTRSNCSAGGLYAECYVKGIVNPGNNNEWCSVEENGSFICSEW